MTWQEMVSKQYADDTYATKTSLNALDNKIVDYIIEQGISGEWEFRKWNSGRVELWGNHYWDLTSTGNYWWGELTLPFNVYPSPATNGIVNFQMTGGGYSIYGLYTDIDRWETARTFRTAATWVSAANGCNVSYYIMGYWKSQG